MDSLDIVTTGRSDLYWFLYAIIKRKLSLVIAIILKTAIGA